MYVWIAFVGQALFLACSKPLLGASCLCSRSIKIKTNGNGTLIALSKYEAKGQLVTSSNYFKVQSDQDYRKKSRGKKRSLRKLEVSHKKKDYQKILSLLKGNNGSSKYRTPR